MQTIPQRHDVLVYADAASYQVEPPYILAGPEDAIPFQTTLRYIAIFLPPGAPFDVEGGVRGDRGWVVLDLDKDASLTLRVRPDAEPGVYPYAVYCEDPPRQPGFAKGRSEPKILIRR